MIGSLEFKSFQTSFKLTIIDIQMITLTHLNIKFLSDKNKYENILYFCKILPLGCYESMNIVTKVSVEFA